MRFGTKDVNKIIMEQLQKQGQQFPKYCIRFAEVKSLISLQSRPKTGIEDIGLVCHITFLFHDYIVPYNLRLPYALRIR